VRIIRGMLFEMPPIPDSERTPLVEVLLRIIELQQERIISLEQRVSELESENALLKERIAQLEKNSSNSSKPPSSDITKPKEEQRQPGKRKVGAQPGHKANWRREFREDEIDRRRKIKLSRCPECQNKLKQRLDEVAVHQQAELVKKPVIVTEYQLRGGFCSCCNKVVYPPIPDGVIPGQLFGPRLLTLFGFMKAEMGVSVSELAEFSAEVLKLKISRGAIQNCIFRVSNAIKAAILPGSSNPGVEVLNYSSS
jgi:transposase